MYVTSGRRVVHARHADTRRARSHPGLPVPSLTPCGGGVRSCADNGNRGKVGAEANLEQWLTASLPSLTTGESKFGVTFDWEVEKLGVPGAVIVKNNHAAEFFLKTVTLDDVPGSGTVTFVANSWVYPVAKYRYDRVFFSNDVSRRRRRQ